MHEINGIYNQSVGQSGCCVSSGWPNLVRKPHPARCCLYLYRMWWISYVNWCTCMPCIVMAVQDHPSRLPRTIASLIHTPCRLALSPPARGRCCRAQYMPIHTYYMRTQIHAAYMPVKAEMKYLSYLQYSMYFDHVAEVQSYLFTLIMLCICGVCYYVGLNVSTCMCVCTISPQEH